MVTRLQTYRSKLDHFRGHQLLASCMAIALMVTALMVTALMVTACGDRGPALDDAVEGEPAQGPLKVGLLLDYSGGLRVLGLPTENGARLAAELINQCGGVLGAEVEVVAVDGATDPQTSVEAARRLIEEEGVAAIIGPLGSATALRVAAEVTIPARVPIICPSATSPQIFSGRLVPPQERGSDQEVIRFVQENVEAVGYVSSQADLGDRVKVLRVVAD